MKKIILFFIFSISIFAFDYKGINTIEFEIYEKTNRNNKIREKEYLLKIKFPEKVYKEVLKPEINKGEIYVYNEEKKLIYYPILNQVIEEDKDEDENYVMKVLKDLKNFDSNKENINFKLKDNKVEEIYYDDGIKILLKDYKEKFGYLIPFSIEVYSDESKISEIKINEIKINLDIKDEIFKLGEN